MVLFRIIPTFSRQYKPISLTIDPLLTLRRRVNDNEERQEGALPNERVRIDWRRHREGKRSYMNSPGPCCIFYTFKCDCRRRKRQRKRGGDLRYQGSRSGRVGPLYQIAGQAFREGHRKALAQEENETSV